MRQGKETSGLVLVVEDNRTLSEMIGEYLEGRGFDVDYAGDGVDGYRLATENNYDVVVLDLMLPRMDGIEVCRRLRSEARKSTPVLMLTARDTLDDKLSGLSQGAGDSRIRMVSSFIPIGESCSSVPPRVARMLAGSSTRSATLSTSEPTWRRSRRIRARRRASSSWIANGLVR